MSKKPVEILGNPEQPVATQVLAESIVALSDAATKLLNSGLTKRAIVVLLRDMLPQCNMAEIEAVLNALPELRKRYTTRK